MNEQPNYFSIIPANVRYDDNLTPNAKLLYGEITSLTNDKGYCWATNEYFADLYKVSKVSISKWISSLVQNGYIESTIEYKENTKEIDKRYLRIVNGGIKEKLNTPIKEKFKENNTSINNKKEYIYIVDSEIDYDEFFDSIWSLYPRKDGKSAVKKSQRKKLYKIGFDEMSRAIDRYKKSVVGRDRQYVLMGSTFFNTRYQDYLDANYEQDKNVKSQTTIALEEDEEELSDEEWLALMKES